MGKQKLILGKTSFSVGDFVEVLAQGRKYRMKIVEFDDYNNMLGEDDQSNPIYIKISKISVIKKISEHEFRGDNENVPTQ